MKRLPWRVIVLALSLLTVGLAAACAAARAGVQVSIQPDAQCGPPGGALEASLWIDEAGSEFNAYRATIRFDPAVLEFISAREESVMTDPPGSTWWIVTPTDSSVTIEHALLQAGESVTGPGALSTMTFHDRGIEGTSDVWFEDVRFLDEGVYIGDVTAHDGIVYVRADCEHAACCLEAEQCEVLTEDECLAAGGSWHFAYASCDPNPCELMGGIPLPRGSIPRLEVCPNPCVGQAVIRWFLPEPSPARLVVLDLSGRSCLTLARHSARGWQAALWEGRDPQGRPVPAGTYFARLTTPGRVFAASFLLIRP